ncbi:nucleotide sugar dehydrogenase [Crinalium epipsammum PCC 9333]|uniref:Nucleotide sugar dehydrogenase n=1 Tax=Crinalium epipsammum PCC 9333 TaxID=1173022 RepID=K9W3J2_9CYAN|nr:nucleotide sugar dehydrogenase [Crinalium epipsammum]AFZ14322.1 nucleotide sugar dehydrogenase [Crinalium epipsammum PCC 9333]
MSDRIAIIGLGYVGLPVALAFAKNFSGTIGFDINYEKVTALKQGIDTTGEIPSDELIATTLQITSDPVDLKAANFFVVAVPTPIDRYNRPDLTPLIKSSETIGKVLQPGSVVVYESTVYPGVTEEICGPILAKASGLTQGIDFKLGYSPERINPGDKEHTIEKIVKVVSGEDAETLERVAKVYGTIIDAGVHRAQSIKVAEAAKVIENTQRDLNIALMNELAVIFDRLGIRTHDVLAAAKTKWNFLPFNPGLVGGHCIGVDPYYLTTKAQQLGYHPEVILAGRRINDSMGTYIAQRLIKLFVKSNLRIQGAKVGILGLTFKENVPDLRNSRVPDIVAELRQFGIEPLVHDSLVTSEQAQHEYGIQLTDWQDFSDLDGMILAVSHRFYLDMPREQLLAGIKTGGVLMDVKSAFDPATLPENLTYWSL